MTLWVSLYLAVRSHTGDGSRLLGGKSLCLRYAAVCWCDLLPCKESFLRAPPNRVGEPRARSKGPRVNEDIRVREVRLIDQEGTQVGIVPTGQALVTARDSGLDLVEVSPDANPPVAKILDYGKFKYAQTRKQGEGKKRQKAGTVKEVRFRPATREHDLEFLIRRLERFLKDGNKVKATVRFRARERFHPEFGVRILERVKQTLEDCGAVERDIMPEQDGRVLSVILAPTGRT